MAHPLDEFTKKHDIQTIDLPSEWQSKEFNISGCEICSPNIGNDVWQTRAYPQSYFDAEINDDSDVFEISICDDCLNYYANGE